MKRLYTCLRELESKRGTRAPMVYQCRQIGDVEKWIAEHGVHVHENDALAGMLVHQCLDGSWAIVLKNGQPCALSTRTTLFREGTVGDDTR